MYLWRFDNLCLAAAGGLEARQARSREETSRGLASPWGNRRALSPTSADPLAVQPARVYQNSRQ
jgi:hypothetical protein